MTLAELADVNEVLRRAEAEYGRAVVAAWGRWALTTGAGTRTPAKRHARWRAEIRRNEAIARAAEARDSAFAMTTGEAQ